MTRMLQFDEATARILDNAYQGADVTRRRRASFDAVDPRPGDRILDLGCGPGLLTLELARGVGTEGSVIGVDPSEAMRTTAKERCAGVPAAEIREGVAEALPLGDGSVDKAVALQVFEYFDDLDTPLAELRRVLRTGGRAVISDMHWDTLVWHSADGSRMARMMAAWNRHLADLRVPETLPARFVRAGFGAVRTIAVPFYDTVLRPDGLARMMMILMADYARQNEILPEAEIAAWSAEQTALAAEGRFFFSLTHFVTVARRV